MYHITLTAPGGEIHTPGKALANQGNGSKSGLSGGIPGRHGALSPTPSARRPGHAKR
ncbi:hypothetical protein OF001_U70026 [Pseudomonas sp. OF001]|nr:hypothetical protein OF001_U70026 [Pseudomonas sp. OF001]